MELVCMKAGVQKRGVCLKVCIYINDKDTY